MEAHKLDTRGIASLGDAADAREGVESFLEKRAPHFRMRPSKDMPSFFPFWQERRYE